MYCWLNGFTVKLMGNTASPYSLLVGIHDTLLLLRSHYYSKQMSFYKSKVCLQPLKLQQMFLLLTFVIYFHY